MYQQDQDFWRRSMVHDPSTGQGSQFPRGQFRQLRVIRGRIRQFRVTSGHTYGLSSLSGTDIPSLPGPGTAQDHILGVQILTQSHSDQIPDSSLQSIELSTIGYWQMRGRGEWLMQGIHPFLLAGDTSPLSDRQVPGEGHLEFL
jgi:hypothetical protein